MTSDHKENLRASFEATFSYHNAMVGTRFTLLGLFLTGSSFLAAVYFTEELWKEARIGVSLLGLLTAILMWLLEIRTYCMALNLVKLGHSIEEKLDIPNSLGFFALMNRGAQDVPLMLPTLRMQLPIWSHKIVRHSVGLELAYLAYGVFWLYCAIHAISG